MIRSSASRPRHLRPQYQHPHCPRVDGRHPKADYTAYFFASSQAMFMQKWVSDGMPYTPHELAKLYEEMTRQFWISTFAPSTKA